MDGEDGAMGKGDFMIDENKLIEDLIECKELGRKSCVAVTDIINNQPKIRGWIPCSKKMPKPEEEVLVLTKSGTITTAMYEDGTIYEGDSCWVWNDCEFKYDEEEDDCIISEGWWEYKHFNTDDVYNNEIDEKVIAWQPLPEPYKHND